MGVWGGGARFSLIYGRRGGSSGRRLPARTPLPPPVAAAADVEGGTNVSDSERHGAMFVPARDKAIVTTIEDARSTARRAT